MEVLSFLINIVHYNVTDHKESVARKIKKQIETFNPIWQKFAQLLSCREDLIDPSLAKELSTFCNQCPAHSHEYSKSIVTKELYIYDKLEFIASGTIAQTYLCKKKDIVIKILHPDSEQKINDAHKEYRSIASSFLFPQSMKPFCDHFFTSLFEQKDFEKEFHNGKIMKEKIGKMDLFVLPEMISYTKNCLVMTYEHSVDFQKQPMTQQEIDKYALALIYFQIMGIQNGIVHSDLHFGNFGINDDKQIVIYDFGLVCNILDENEYFKNQWALALGTKNTTLLCSILLHNKKAHLDVLQTYMTDDFSSNIKKIIFYFQKHNLELRKEFMSILFACLQCEVFNNMVKNHYTPQEVFGLLDYPEFSKVKTLISGKNSI